MSKKTIKLISDSGLQFVSFNITISEDFNRKNRINYVEEFNIEKEIFWFEEVIYNKENETWLKKSELIDKGFLDSENKFTDDFDLSSVKEIRYDDVKQNINIKNILKSFSGKWIPLPFFRNNNINLEIFGPTDWVRMMITKKENDQYIATFVIDTKTASEESQTLSPFISSNVNDNIFSIVKSTDHVLSYLDSRKDCEWVLEYIENEFSFDNTDSSLVHIASYQMLIKLLISQDEIFNIQLFKKRDNSISVDMTIDIGNSTTCALLFEESNNENFNFSKVKKLEVIDLERPYIFYNESFDSDIVFSKPNFNNNFSKKDKFLWPSLVRFGEEATRLVNSANIEMSLDRNPITYLSSPKRYLWDNAISKNNWEYINKIMKNPQAVYLEGVSNHLQIDGSIVENNEDVMGSSPKFSKSSLMMFMFLEIYTNALRQINSINFRAEHGNIEYSRALRNIIITCPTSMIIEEQIKLRQASEDALEILKRNDYDVLNTETFPRVADLKISTENIEDRKDWSYDEATCTQIVYLYTMISHKFKNNALKFFEKFGKEKEVTIASIDIGGGTTDLMITNTKYNDKKYVTPNPIFWETFNLAGDDLLKELIQQVIIEGNSDHEGILESFLRRHSDEKNYRIKLNSFFGEDSNNIGYKGKIMRKNFLNQVSKPVMRRFLQFSNEQDKEFKYNEIFDKNEPCSDLLNYFENHFGFSLKEIIWKTNSHLINKISKSIFDKLIGQICKIIKQFDADILLLSGRTFKLNSVEELFMTYQPLMPNRMINLNNYWIGDWFPFTNNTGFISDQKSVLSVGSLISLISSKHNKLEDFRMDTELLQRNNFSNANYIGEINNDMIENSCINKDKEEGLFTVNKLPYSIGFKKIESKSYPSRNIYVFDIDREKLLKKLKTQKKVDEYIFKLRESMPLKIEINRDLSTSKEKLFLSEITDKDENNLSKNNFKFQLNTLKSKDGYWLDDGKFVLKAQ